ncbi:cytochrome-c oxidase, cbb3-type subunit III [Pelagibaculum spongiae]|uniref:Cbb3-type cytochrome c oxidase subunit n=1 Tax=Pelagibaculum spongiae TaxID=2080658 RepID=A0A2V1GV90_9GAMM|nr:cytochrome-c oxidase, cbb3-type subunit III [Pelagibaculum spongiae]PVZ70315.1 cytochrome-c oxidase, cbb3-type subunit III [Pelagibaculum spongiae]
MSQQGNKIDVTEVPDTGHSWDDGAIRELINSPPTWWIICFHASWIFAVAYFIIYPAVPLPGGAKAVTEWSSIKEYRASLAELEEIRGPWEAKLEGKTAEEILANPELKEYTLASARVIFGDNCAACHGKGGAGGPNFPVLADDDWLYGADVAAIEHSLTYGRQGVMTAHEAIMTEQEITLLANYVVDLSEGKANAEGANLFQEKACFACHGMNGKGIAALGSANLTDAIWRFQPGDGDNYREQLVESAKYTIKYGVNTGEGSRNAVMPAFGEKLTEKEIRKLAVYVKSLGGA